MFLITNQKIFIGCTADIGWVTGHSYIIYGPLSNGATTIMFEGVQIILTVQGGGKL